MLGRSVGKARMRLRTVLIVLSVILLVVPAVAAVTLVAFGPNLLRGLIAARLQTVTGRAVEVSKLTVAWSLRPTVSIDGLAIANASWGSSPTMLRAGHLELQLGLLPLLGDRLELDHVVARDLDILLEIAADHQPNWETRRSPPGAPTRRSGSTGSGPDLRIGDLRIENARVTFRDDSSAITESVDIAALLASAEAGVG